MIIQISDNNNTELAHVYFPPGHGYAVLKTHNGVGFDVCTTRTRDEAARLARDHEQKKIEHIILDVQGHVYKLPPKQLMLARDKNKKLAVKRVQMVAGGMKMPEKLFSEIEVLDLIKIGRSTLRRLVKRGEFPAPIRVTKDILRWTAKDISEWIEQKKQVRG